MKTLSNLRVATLGLIVGALVLAGAATSAQARPGPGPDRDWHRHEVVAHHEWHGPHGPPPRAVYAPPVVYAPPPPPSPGINLILPLNFR